MSLSNTPDETFKPLSVQSLDAFNDEVSTAGENAEPDFDRFKLLIDQSVFESDQQIDFKALYEPPKTVEKIIFEPLIKPKPKKKPIDSPPAPGASGEVKTENEKNGIETTPQPTPEELGYEKGFEKGLADGKAKGFEEGFATGVEQGHQEGMEKGLLEGMEQGRAQGLEEGMEQGTKQGLEEAQNQAGEILQSLQESLNQADQTADRLVDIYEDRIVELIQKIAEKAIFARIEIDDEMVKPMILDALKTLVQPEEVVLNVSVDDYEYIEMVKDQFFEEIESLNHISVRSDPSVNRGGCRIETSTATVSTDPEERLQSIFDAMRNAGKA